MDITDIPIEEPNFVSYQGNLYFRAGVPEVREMCCGK